MQKNEKQQTKKNTENTEMIVYNKNDKIVYNNSIKNYKVTKNNGQISIEIEKDNEKYIFNNISRYQVKRENKSNSNKESATENINKFLILVFVAFLVFLGPFILIEIVF